MKKINLLLSILLITNMGLNAQVNLVGAAYNPSTQMIDIVKWQELSEFTLFSNVSEFDMSTGKIYDLRLDADEYISVNEFDIVTGTDSLIGVNYDNANDKLFALNATYDSLFNYTGNEIVEIDKETGDIIVLAALDEFTGFVGGSSSFDQNTGSFLLSGVDTSNLLRMIVFDTYTNTYETGFVPGVSEIACDYTIFALNNYIITSVIENKKIDFSVSPNPATERLTIAVDSGEDVMVRVYSTNGNLVISKEFSAGENIELNLDFLPAGAYLVNVLSGGMNGTKKIQIL